MGSLVEINSGSIPSVFHLGYAIFHLKLFLLFRMIWQSNPLPKSFFKFQKLNVNALSCTSDVAALHSDCIIFIRKSNS